MNATESKHVALGRAPLKNTFKIDQPADLKAGSMLANPFFYHGDWRGERRRHDKRGTLSASPPGFARWFEGMTAVGIK
jgi:hypothetical protein